MYTNLHLVNSGDISHRVPLVEALQSLQRHSLTNLLTLPNLLCNTRPP
jgi:hypothetical protein